MEQTSVRPMTWEQAVQWLRSQSDRRDMVRACFFDDPVEVAARRFRDCEEWQATRALLPRPPGRALDVGAGRGIASFALESEGWSVTALEPDPSDLVGAGAIQALVDATGAKIDIVQEWGENLPFPDRHFDLVLCRQVLHHARDLNRLCAQISRVLKPGGKMIATREHVISRHSDLAAFQASHPLHSLYGGEHAFLLAEYRHAIIAAGLKLTQCLNPWQSNINLFPETIDDYRSLISRRTGMPIFIVRPWMLAWYASGISTPGRLYSFVARKPNAPL